MRTATAAEGRTTRGSCRRKFEAIDAASSSAGTQPFSQQLWSIYDDYLGVFPGLGTSHPIGPAFIRFLRIFNLRPIMSINYKSAINHWSILTVHLDQSISQIDSHPSSLRRLCFSLLGNERLNIWATSCPSLRQRQQFTTTSTSRGIFLGQLLTVQH